MTFDQAEECQARALQNTVFVNGKAGIGGARWIKPAGGKKKGRYKFLIYNYEPDRYISKAMDGTLYF